MNAPNITDSPDAPLAVRSSDLLATFGDNYPIMAELSGGWVLVAHPNGPAIANRCFDYLGSLAHPHEEVPEHIRNKAVWRLMQWAGAQPTWPKVANAPGEPPARENQKL